MERFKKYSTYGSIALAYVLTVLICILAIVVSLLASGGRAFLNYLITNVLHEVDDLIELDEWTYTHPIDIFIDLFTLIKTRMFPTNLMESFKTSNPGAMQRFGDDSSDESGLGDESANSGNEDIKHPFVVLEDGKDGDSGSK